MSSQGTDFGMASLALGNKDVKYPPNILCSLVSLEIDVRITISIALVEDRVWPAGMPIGSTPNLGKCPNR